MLFDDVGSRCDPGPARIVLSLVERDGSLLASFCADLEKGSGPVSPVANVWPRPLPVDADAAVGLEVEFPRPVRPSHAWAPGVLIGTGVMRGQWATRIFFPGCAVGHAR